MGTAGSGDVLTGMITALIARGYTALDAAVVATFMHGLAGDLALADIGTVSLMASDIIEYLPRAYKKFYK